jgi:hypothetical protein
VDDWGREFVGTDAIRGWSDREFIGKHVSLEIRGIEQNGEATVVTADVGGEGPTFSFLVDGDSVSRMMIRAQSPGRATIRTSSSFVEGSLSGFLATCRRSPRCRSSTGR